MRLLSLALVSLAAAAEATDTSLYVATDGDDGNPGTGERPLATLVGARDRVREVKSATQAVTVWFADGTYLFDEAVWFGRQDSGTPQAPIAYRASEGAEVRFSGGQAVGDWRPVSDPAVRERLVPEARDHVQVTDLRAQGIVDYGRLGRRGSGRGIPREESGWVEAELFWNDEPMTIARWPNEGFRGVHEVHSEQRIEIDSDRLVRWVAESDPWILAYWFYDWAELYEPIAGLEPENQILLRPDAVTPGYGIDAGRTRWYAFNLFERDRSARRILPRSRQRPAVFLAACRAWRGGAVAS